MKSKSLASVLAAGAAVTLVAGCQPSSSVAADVAGHRISVDELENTITGCQEQGLQFRAQEGIESQLLTSMVFNEIARVIADERGLDITDEDAAAVATQSESYAQASGNEQCKQLLQDSAFFQLVIQEIPEEELMEQLASADVEVNPRYGQWNGDDSNGEQLGIHGTGSLSDYTQGTEPLQQ